MTGLEKKAISILNNSVDERFRSPNHIGSGVYRNVYGFTYSGRKYVAKVDNFPDQSGSITSYSNIGEYLYWEKHKGSIRSEVLAPVLSFGNYRDRTFLIMRCLQTVGSITVNHKKLYTKRIIPQLRAALPSLRLGPWSKLVCNEFDDLNINNFGMNNRGRWFIIDYQEPRYYG